MVDASAPESPGNDDVPAGMMELSDSTKQSTGSLTEGSGDGEVTCGARKYISHSGASSWKMNLNLKKKLVKADSKLRDLLVQAGRRGSTPTGSVQNVTTPQDDNPATAFGSVAWDSERRQSQPLPAEPKFQPPEESVSSRPNDLNLFDSDGNPTRPPRRKHPNQRAFSSPSALPLQTHASSSCEVLKHWPVSADASSTVVFSVLDLRFDESDAAGIPHSKFLDNIVRKFSKKLVRTNSAKEIDYFFCCCSNSSSA